LRAALQESPPRPARARAELRLALDLHRRGAALSDRDVWIATEGIGVSYLVEHDFASARTWLDAALRSSPDPAQTHYNLACARCGAGDREGCVGELESALAAARRSEVRDPSPRTHRSPAFWVLRSRGPLGAAALEFQKIIRSFGPGEISETQLAQFAHFAGFVPPGTVPQSVPQWPLWLQHRQSLRNGDAAFRHDDDIARLRRFQQPVLLFKGGGSPDYLREIIDVLGQELPSAQVEDLPGAHALHIASMTRFMEIFRAFLKGVVAA
jgi:hypothetical protein